MSDHQFSAEWCRAAAGCIAELEQRLAAAEAEVQTWKDKCGEVAAELSVLRLKYEGGC